MCHPYSYIIYITLHDYTLTRILHWHLCRECGFTGYTCINYNVLSHSTLHTNEYMFVSVILLHANEYKYDEQARVARDKNFGVYRDLANVQWKMGAL